MLAGFLWIFYGVPAVVALINLILMPRQRKTAEDPGFTVLIPARNEADKIGNLVRTLLNQGSQVFVFDDESEDETGEIASANGATVIRSKGLPSGWVGKNHACHQLALAAAEASPHEWMLFLDADVLPADDFVASFRSTLKAWGARFPVITGFAELLPGRAPERAYFAWVPWVLLATNPFGLVARTGKGHNFFTNGQVVAWKSSTYFEVMPHEAVRAEVLEDVKIGRMLARQNVRVLVVNLADSLKVKMYDDFFAAVRGMSKNSSSIAGSALGTVALAGLFFAWAGAWILHPPTYLALVVSGVCATAVVTRGSSRVIGVLTAVMLPLTLLGAGLTCLWSLRLKAKRALEWKGRTYP